MLTISMPLLKQTAKAIKKELRVTHAIALDIVAKQNGFDNWSILSNCHRQTKQIKSDRLSDDSASHYSEPLYRAIWDDSIDSMRLLLENGAKTENIHCDVATGPISALHLAAELNTPDKVELLLRYGGDPNAKDFIGRTPLFSAIVGFKGSAISSYTIKDYTKRGIHPVPDFEIPGVIDNQIAIFDVLIRHGADIQARSNDGYTLLHEAISRQNAPAIHYFLDKGLELSARDNRGYTVFHFAVQTGNADIFDFLASKVEDIKPFVMSKGGKERIGLFDLVYHWRQTGLIRHIVDKYFWQHL